MVWDQIRAICLLRIDIILFSNFIIPGMVKTVDDVNTDLSGLLNKLAFPMLSFTSTLLSFSTWSNSNITGFLRFPVGPKTFSWRWITSRGGGYSLYKLYRHVLPQRVWFVSRFCLKMGIDFDHFGLKSGMVFKGTTRAYKRFCHFNSKCVIEKLDK